jgi:branched-chain amino acid transport system substrate-binding protein
MDRRTASGEARRRHGSGARVCVAAALLGLMVLAAGCNSGTVTSSSALPTSSTSSSATTVTSSLETTTTTGLPEVVRIGALFPLTGDLAAEGESALKGMRLAIEEVNSAGGIASLGGAPLTLQQADSQGDTRIGEAEVKRLAETEGVVAIVGAGQSTVAIQATEVAEGLTLPFLISSGAADEVTERGLAYTFRLCPKADWYARDQVAFLETLQVPGGVTKVALLHEDGEYGKQAAESQRAYLAAAGIEVVADIEYSAETADVHNQILAVKRSGAQALLTVTFLADAALIARDASVLRLNMPIIDAAGGMLAPTFVTDAGDSSESMASVAEYAPGTTSSLALAERMAAQGTVLDAEMLYGYQAVWVLANALERANSVDGPRLRLALATTALFGEHLVLPQELLTFDGSGQNRQARLVVAQVQEGRMVTVWPVEYAGAAIHLP